MISILSLQVQLGDATSKSPYQSGYDHGCDDADMGDAQTLAGIPNNKFNRWRCDPPYNQKTAQKMYGTNLPVTGELLKAGARVCKVGSLLFLLLGPQNYQWCPYGIKRVGWVAITIVPNNELRALHVFYKYVDSV